MSEEKWQAKNYGDVPQHFELKYSGHRWFLLTDDPWDNGPKDEETGEYAMEHRHTAVASVYSYDADARKATAELLASAPELAAEVAALRVQRDALLDAAKALLHTVTEGAIHGVLMFNGARGYGHEDEATIKAIADTRAAIDAATGAGAGGGENG